MRRKRVRKTERKIEEDDKMWEREKNALKKEEV